MNIVTIYTDGSCSPNPGPGGWAAILSMGQRGKTLSGSAADTTSNQMELCAIYEGIKALLCPCEVIVVTDSQNAIGWLAEGWRRKNAQCRALCEKIETVIQMGYHHVSWVKVDGHSGHRWNEAADRLANSARVTGETLRLAEV